MRWVRSLVVGLDSANTDSCKLSLLVDEEAPDDHQDTITGATWSNLLDVGLETTIENAHFVAGVIPCDRLGEVTSGRDGVANSRDVCRVLRVDVEQLHGVRASVDNGETTRCLVDLDRSLREQGATVGWLALGASTIRRDGFYIGLHDIYQRRYRL